MHINILTRLLNCTDLIEWMCVHTELLHYKGIKGTRNNQLDMGWYLKFFFFLFFFCLSYSRYELYIYCFVLSQRPKTAHGAYLQQAPKLPRYATCSGGVEWIKKSLGANGRSVFVLAFFFRLDGLSSIRRSRFIRWFNSYPKSYEIVRVLHNHRKEEDNMTIGYTIYNIQAGESCWKQINFSCSVFFICCWRCRCLLYHRSS